MCIRDSDYWIWEAIKVIKPRIVVIEAKVEFGTRNVIVPYGCLLYTSDAADERSSVDLGGRRIIKKKKNVNAGRGRHSKEIHKST